MRLFCASDKVKKVMREAVIEYIEEKRKEGVLYCPELIEELKQYADKEAIREALDKLNKKNKHEREN